MNISSARRLIVEGGGRQIVGHAGLHALGRFADVVGVGAALSSAVPRTGERAPFHDLGKVLVQAMLMLAGRGEACWDIEQLRVEDRLFGEVASDSTLYRTMTGTKPDVLDGFRAAFAGVRRRMWIDRLDQDRGVVLDVDSSLVGVHSKNKDQAAPTYKGGFGFHPMFCFADLTGETLAACLRPGNAGANTIVDLLEVVDDAIAQPPAEVGVGHRNGDAADTLQRRVQVLADSAGGTQGFVTGLRTHNIGFAEATALAGLGETFPPLKPIVGANSALDDLATELGYTISVWDVASTQASIMSVLETNIESLSLAAATDPGVVGSVRLLSRTVGRCRRVTTLLLVRRR